MAEHQKADFEYQTTVATVLSVARRARSIFEQSSDIAGKRAFLSCLLQNPTIHGKKLEFTVASPFDLVLELADCPKWLQRLEAIARHFAFEKGAYCPNLRLEERMANETDEWVMAGARK